jgi:hypothetical protein
MDLIAEVAAAEEIQLAQIKANTAGFGGTGSSEAHGQTAAVGSPASDVKVPMGVSVGSDLSTEVRVFVFGWADSN